MEQTISKDNWILCLRGSVNVWIDESEKEKVNDILKYGALKVFQLRGRTITTDAVLYIIPAKDYEEAMYIRRGFWRGECGHWNDRSAKKCAICYY